MGSKWTKRTVQADFGTGILHELFVDGHRKAVLEFIRGWGWNVQAVVDGTEQAEGALLRCNQKRAKRWAETHC